MAYLDESGVTSLTADIKALADADYAPYAQGIEYIVGTQTAATNAWTGVTVDSTLRTGKVIAYKLPYAGNNSAATLNLTLAGGTKTGAKALRRQGSSTVTTHFAAGNVIVMIYDGTYWQVSAFYDGNTNTVPTGYCTTGAATAAKSATCTYGYRDDANYFPCLFRYANTAANATLAIASYATTALPIYVNGARTSSSNTFGAGVILFLYYNNAYYCYNDGRFPIVVNGAVTSVQEAIAAAGGGSETSWYGTCETASMSSKKLVTIDGFTSSDVVEGALITVQFRYNSLYADGMTLAFGISGTEYGVYYNGSATSTDNPLTWAQPNNAVTFIYHYPNWHYVSASSPIIPKASASTLGGVKVGSGLSIDSDGVLSASGGGGGGGSVLTLYTNASWSVLYADQARTQTFIDYCGWSIDAAVAAIQSADVVKVEYSSGSVSETCFVTSFYVDTLEDERRVCLRDRNCVDRSIDILWE